MKPKGSAEAGFEGAAVANMSAAGAEVFVGAAPKLKGSALTVGGAGDDFLTVVVLGAPKEVSQPKPAGAGAGAGVEPNDKPQSSPPAGLLVVAGALPKPKMSVLGAFACEADVVVAGIANGSAAAKSNDVLVAGAVLGPLPAPPVPYILSKASIVLAAAVVVVVESRGAAPVTVESPRGRTEASPPAARRSKNSLASGWITGKRPALSICHLHYIYKRRHNTYGYMLSQ